MFFLIFIFGLVIGSFINAAAYRFANDRPIFIDRSFCPKCKKQLAWWQLVPELSVLMLRARCYYCGKPISVLYPIVELATGLSFLGFAYFNSALFKDTLLLAAGLLVIALLVFIALYDFKEYLILDISILAGVILSLFLAYLDDRLLLSVISGLGLMLIFGAIFLASKGKWIGFGDVKLAVFLGVLNGSLVAVSLILASYLGTFIGLGLILAKRGTLKTQMPFGTLLAFGSIVTLVFQGQIQDFLRQILLI